jgi:hypothetical protein
MRTSLGYILYQPLILPELPSALACIAPRPLYTTPSGPPSRSCLILYSSSSLAR